MYKRKWKEKLMFVISKVLAFCFQRLLIFKLLVQWENSIGCDHCYRQWLPICQNSECQVSKLFWALLNSHIFYLFNIFFHYFGKVSAEVMNGLHESKKCAHITKVPSFSKALYFLHFVLINIVYMCLYVWNENRFLKMHTNHHWA